VNDSHLPPRYRSPERIARGGMGEIFRAEDADLRASSRSRCWPTGTPTTRRSARFTREALAAARLSNAPSTVTIFDVGEHDDHPYIVMEYLAGGSLADRLVRDGAQPIGRSLDWLQQAAAALDAAHASGVVHRDVKPANLLLDSDDRVKVVRLRRKSSKASAAAHREWGRSSARPATSHRSRREARRRRRQRSLCARGGGLRVAHG
jgi:serine/threonine-protein kinase